jgi:hypothetical protein
VLSSGSWLAVHTGMIDGELGDELPLILDREMVWAGLSSQPSVYVYAPEHAEFLVPPQLASKVNSLLPEPRYDFAASDSQYAMAMSVE